MKKLIFILIIAIFIISCQKEKKDTGFVLNGIAKNVPDNSLIILSIDDEAVDSAKVISEKFKFTGKVDEPIKAVMTIKNTSNSKSLWIENVNLKFIGKKNNFEKSTITGSKIQSDNDELDFKLASIKKQQDSLMALLENEENKIIEYENQLIEDDVFIQFEKTLEQSGEIKLNFIKQKPNSPISVNILNSYKDIWGKEKTRNLFSLMNQKTKNSTKGSLISNFLKLYGNPKVGDNYIDFQLPNTNGDIVKASDELNKYLLIDFWASWCAPCREEFPKLKQIYNEYNKEGFNIIGVSLDHKKKDWINAIKKDKTNWINLSDLKGNNSDVVLIYGVNGIPDNFLINEKGIIIARGIPPNKLKTFLQKTLKTKH